MYFLRVISLVVCFAALASATSTISAATYANLVRFAHFSSAAYISPTCSNVLTATVQNTFNKPGAVGYVALDTSASQIIVAFQGSNNIADFEADADIVLESWSDPISGSYCLLCEVHEGFYNAFYSVESYINTYVSNLHNAHPSFSIIVTGHSLGGALTPFAALYIKSLRLGATIQIYSYGQPRVGSVTFANFVNSQIGQSNIFRVTHVGDVVPQLIPYILIYAHHETEYYIKADPSSQANVVQCSGNEDSGCSDGQNLSWSNLAALISATSPHHTYVGVGMGNSCSGN